MKKNKRKNANKETLFDKACLVHGDDWLPHLLWYFIGREDFQIHGINGQSDHLLRVLTHHALYCRSKIIDSDELPLVNSPGYDEDIVMGALYDLSYEGYLAVRGSTENKSGVRIYVEKPHPILAVFWMEFEKYDCWLASNE